MAMGNIMFPARLAEMLATISWTHVLLGLGIFALTIAVGLGVAVALLIDIVDDIRITVWARNRLGERHPARSRRLKPSVDYCCQQVSFFLSR
jgi:hypothetical protein